MSGTVLENLSGRKLSVLVSILLILQVLCFLLGGLIAPAPAGTLPILATVCKDPEPTKPTLNRWILPESCEKIDLSKEEEVFAGQISGRDLVFVAKMPLYGADFSRWQQNLVGVLSIDLVHKKSFKMDPALDVEFVLDAQLAYSNKDDKTWRMYAHSKEVRRMDCTIEDLPDGYPYNCSSIPFFELGTLYHDYYLLNLRFAESPDKNSGWIQDVNLHIIFMNGGFTIVWLSLKTIFLPLVLIVMYWFWNRVHLLDRKPALLEWMLIYLAAAIAFLDIPIEFLTLKFEMPYMLLLNDIRQGVFYAFLLSFWLVFAGEHMLISDYSGERNSLKIYWKHLSAIVIGCTSLLVFDLCERGVQLRNPFYSIWVTPLGTNLALTFIILAGISAGLYFCFLCYMIWKVFKNISIKRATLPNMSSARRLHYEGIIYRFNFLMLATLICAGVTIASFILSQINEGEQKWDDEINLELSSALFTGVYGMWNLYICAMLMLYAPSHKKWPTETVSGENAEEVELQLPSDGMSSPNEISSLTSFASKTNLD